MNHQGQVVIIGGTPRSGKTTLSLRLERSGFSRISFDHLERALSTAFPDVLPAGLHDQNACSERLFVFFRELVLAASEDAAIYGTKTVFDVYCFTPEYVSRLPAQDKLRAIFLGYPDYCVQEIEYNIRHYAKPDDWIAQVDEDYLHEVAVRCQTVNQTLLDQCSRYGYPLINTMSGSRRDQVLDELFASIVK